jgi:hypothetical protein
MFENLQREKKNIMYALFKTSEYYKRVVPRSCDLKTLNLSGQGTRS